MVQKLEDNITNDGVALPSDATRVLDRVKTDGGRPKVIRAAKALVALNMGEIQLRLQPWTLKHCVTKFGGGTLKSAAIKSFL